MNTKPAKTNTKNILIALVLILAVGLFLRGIYLFEIIKKPSFDSPDVDARFHDYWAKGIAFDDWTVPAGLPHPQVQDTAYIRPPLYPYFLAVIFKAGGGNYLLVRIVQMLLGLANAVLAFVLAKRWFGNAAALIASFLMCTYWIFIYFEGELMAPVIIVCLTLCMMLALDSWIKKFTYKNTITAGILFGLAVLARPNMLLFAPAVIVWALWLKIRNKKQRLLVAITGFVAGSIITIAPSAVRNYAVSKDFVLLTSSSGINLYIGNNEQTDCVWPKIPILDELIGKKGWTAFDVPDIHRAIEINVGRKMKPSKVSGYFTKRAWDFIKNNPGKTAKLTVKKAFLFWGPAEVSNNSIIQLDRESSAVLKYLPGFPMALSLFLLGAAMLFVNVQKQRKTPGVSSIFSMQIDVFILILLFIAVYFASYLPFFIAARYRVPVIPFLLILAAYGINCIVRFFLNRNLKASVVSIVIAVILYVFASHDFVDYQPNVALWHQQNADVFLRTGHTQKAIEEYLNALRLQPNNYRSLVRLGEACFINTEYENAVNYWKKAVDIKPGDKDTHARLGDAFRNLADFDSAVNHWSIAASLDPSDPLFPYNIGLVYHKKGMLDKAVEYYEKALSIDPNHKKAKNNLTFILQQKNIKNNTKTD
ncbi:MAG: tetratricopeptide repeat protein, partial [Planctomycetota bacterium]